MKNLFSKSLLYLGVLGLLVLAACSDDDEGDDVDPVIGTWNFVSATITGITVDGADINAFFTAAGQAQGLQDEALTAFVDQSVSLFESGVLATFQGLTADFNADATYSINLSTGPTTGGWVANADNTVYTLSPDPDDEDPNPVDLFFNVVTLTATDANFTFDFPQATDLTGDGMDNIIVASLDMNLTKAQ